MIISASRRTDIPTYYSKWFFNRLKEGYVLVRNPMNAHQISKIPLNPDVVDGIVFWTKNPIPMLENWICSETICTTSSLRLIHMHRTSKHTSQVSRAMSFPHSKNYRT